MVVTEQRTSPKEIGETQAKRMIEGDRPPIGRRGRKEPLLIKGHKEEIGISHLLHPWVRSSDFLYHP